MKHRSCLLDFSGAVRSGAAFGVMVFVFAGQPATIAHAQQTAKHDKVEQLIQAMHLQATFNQMMDQVVAQETTTVQQLFPEIATDAKQKQQHDALMEKATALVRSGFSWESLEPEYAKIYEDAYTNQELDGMLAFYNSPVGKAVLAKTPEILRESQAISVERLGALAPKMRALMEEAMANAHSAQPNPAVSK